MVELQREPQKLNRVIKKLDLLSQPTALFSSLNSENIVNKLDEYFRIGSEKINQDKVRLVERLSRGERGEEVAYDLIIHLFLAARKRIPEGKFDKERELQNVHAVASLLVGNDPEVKTGKGKSSTTAPILLMFKALWEQQSNIAQVFSPPNESLLNEVIENYLSLKGYFIVDLPDIEKEYVETNSRFTKDKSKREIKDDGENLFDETFTEPHDGYVEALLSGSKTLFQTHNQAIFSAMERVEAGLPTIPILFDEGHQLKSEHFISTTDTGERKKPQVNQEALIDTSLGAEISSFTLAKLVYQSIIGNKRNFFYQGNNLNLSEQGRKTVKNICHKLRKNQKDTRFQLKKIVYNFILPGVDYETSQKNVVASQIEKQIDQFWTDLGQQNELQGDLGVDPKLTYLEYLAENITNAMGGIKPGQDIIIQDGKKIVREAQRGILLKSHQYSSDVSFFLSVVNDDLSFEYVPPTTRLRYKLSFPSWLAYTRGRTQVLTANLFETDLQTGKKRKNTFANILEELTDARVEKIESGLKEEVLPLPKPKILENMDYLVDSVVQQTNERIQKTPELIICYNDYLAQDLLERFHNQEIGLISSTTSEEETQRLLQDFADGKIKILITSGKAGYGADIKKSDGSFPNFHISIINPESQTAVNQGFGRLRGEKSVENFSLLFTENFLKQLATYFYEKKPLPLIPYNTTGKFIQLIEDYKNGKNGKNFLKQLYELLRINDLKEKGDYIFQAKLELTFLSRIKPVIMEIKKGIITRLMEDQGSLLTDLVDKFTLNNHASDFVRKMINQDIINLLSLPEEDLWQTFFTDATFFRYKQGLAGNDDALINHLINDWHGKMTGPESQLQEFWLGLLNDPEYLNHEVTPLLQKRVEYYDRLCSLALSQVPIIDIQPSEITNINILPLPEIKTIKNSNPFFIKITQVDDLIKIGNGKYIVLIKHLADKQQSLFLVESKNEVSVGELLVGRLINIDELKKDVDKITASGEKSFREQSGKKTYFFFPKIKDINRTITSFGVVSLDL